MLVVGLTGGIGSGKTTVADHFAKLGITLVDADLLAREVVDIGSPALAAIIERFGPDIVDTDGTLKRSTLRQIVFAKPAEKQWLEQLLHPLIRELIQQRIQSASSPYCILVSPLLLETDQSALVDRILVVDVLPETQLARTMLRDNSQEETIRAIMASQIQRDDRLKRADDVISNDGSADEIAEKVLALHENYLQLTNRNYD